LRPRPNAMINSRRLEKQKVSKSLVIKIKLRHLLWL